LKTETEIRGQKSEGRSKRAEVRKNKKREVSDQRSEVRTNKKTEDRRSQEE
jgi:hypothetical protein